MNEEMRSGKWLKTEAVALKERTLGVIGVGNIGRAVVRRAHAFGMKLFGTDPVAPPTKFLLETELRMAPLNELLRESDFISLHCDLNPTSFHLIGQLELERMRSSAYLINTSRGPVIDESALVCALRSKRIAGAALDVFENEPLPTNSPLRSFANCLLAPHNANADPSARDRVHELTVNNLLNGLRQ